MNVRKAVRPLERWRLGSRSAGYQIDIQKKDITILHALHMYCMCVSVLLCVSLSICVRVYVCEFVCCLLSCV